MERILSINQVFPISVVSLDQLRSANFRKYFVSLFVYISLLTMSKFFTTAVAAIFEKFSKYFEPLSAILICAFFT